MVVRSVELTLLVPFIDRVGNRVDLRERRCRSAATGDTGTT